MLKYDNFIKTLNLFDLTEDRKTSIFNFFTKKVNNILNELKKVISCGKSTLFLYPNEYFFKFTKELKEKSINNKNINFSIYIPAELYNEENKRSFRFNYFLCNLPLLIDNNHFLINGIPKVMTQQLSFDPTFLIEDNAEIQKALIYNENLSYNLIISNEISSAQPNNSSNILTRDLKFFNFINDKVTNSNEDFKLKYLLSKKKINKGNLTTFFSDIFKNLKINNKTRYKLNKTLNINLPENLLYITKIDFFYIIEKLTEINKKKKINNDLDDLENKSVKDLDDYYSAFLKKHIKNLNYFIIKSKTTNLIKSFLKQLKRDSLSTQFDEMFSNSDVSLGLDQVNPLSMLSQQKKILNLKRQEGNKNISTDIRNIHPSIFGRLCVIDTPEGESAGLISSLTTLSSVNKFGLIETPLSPFKNDQIIIENETRFFDLGDEKLKNVSFTKNNEPFYSLEIKKNVNINKEFFEIKNKKSNNKFLSYMQVFSIACASIPFLEHNDGNRMLMGANMQKQAVPLLYPENAIVSSGLEDLIAHSSIVMKSLSEGVISYSDNSKLIIKSKNGNKLIYYLDKIKGTFNETAINYSNNKYWPGEPVYCGEILANGFSLKNSELALGTNLTVAYMNWDGLNFEDAIIISDRLIKNDKLTSLHTKTLFIEIESDEDILWYDELTKKIQSFIKINNYTSHKLGTVVKVGDILFLKKKKANKEIANKITMVESDFDGIITNIELLDSKISHYDNKQISFQNSKIRVDLLQIRKIKVGDKLSGRYGNKGVISKIVPEVNMPFLLDGTSVDILINPLGIPSRMNIGQIFETILGFIGTTLSTRYQILPFDECFAKDATKILLNQKLKEKNLNLRKNYFMLNTDKNFVIDGRTGEVMDNPVLVGRSYILKLYHMVDDKITSRTLGPNNLITGQPLKGKKSDGGQRFGEMEVWALEAYGASYTLNEILNLKSDDIITSDKLLNFLENDIIFDLINYSKSIFLLDLDLRSLGFDLSLNSINFNGNNSKSISPISLYKEKDIFINAQALFKKLYAK